MSKNKKAIKKTKSQILRSKKSLFVVAIIIAGLTVFGYYTFAGANTKGRVLSWKQGKVLYNYRIAQSTPGGFQYVQIRNADGTYKGVYTEKTDPPIGVRERDVTKPLMFGDDIRALNVALKLIGEKYYYKAGLPTQIKSSYTSFANIQVSGYLDTYTSQAVNDLSDILPGGKAVVSIAGASSDDRTLNKADMVEILSFAVSPVGLQTQGSVFNYKKQRLEYNGEIRDVPGKSALNRAAWDFNKSAYPYTNISQNGIYKPTNNYLTTLWVNVTNPNFGSRVMKEGDRGDDVKALQSMLKYIAKKKHINVSGFRVNGRYDSKTSRAVTSLCTECDGKKVDKNIFWKLYEEVSDTYFHRL